MSRARSFRFLPAVYRLGLGLLLVFGVGVLGERPHRAVVIARGAYSAVSSTQLVVIQSLDTYRRLAGSFGPDTESLDRLAAQELGSRVWVAAFLGERPHSGYQVLFAGERERSHGRILRFKTIREGTGCLYSEALSRPYILISLPKIAETIVPEWDQEITVTDCP